jgi:phosphatidylserine decarboxylase
MKRHYTAVISSKFGKFASKKFPKPIQRFINSSYVKLMGLDMSEFDTPDSYPSLNALFTRALRQKRKLPKGKKVVISPVDALITDFGEIENGKGYQIKGMEYKISELFGANHQEATQGVDGGCFLNLYLSPKDYHRYHMPERLKIVSLTHIPAKLYPVNLPLLRNKRNLFIENERVIIECRDESENIFVMVLVGALNVGKMVVTFESRVRTNSDITEPQHYRYDDLWLERGELFGWFEMGSTILLFSQKGALELEVCLNQKVKFGEPIGVKL